MGLNIFMSISMYEPTSFDYLFFDENNDLHVFLPVVGGSKIGIDNTCQTHLELHKFFGLGGHKSAIEKFSEYKSFLEKILFC